MKVPGNYIEKIFLPVLGAVIVSGVTAIINIHTKLEVLRVKVSSNTERIERIFDRLEKIRDDQREILRILLDNEQRRNKN